MNDELSDGDFDEEAEQAFHETPNRLDANRRDDSKEDAQQEDEELALDMRVDDGSDLASSHGGSPGDTLQRMVEDAGNARFCNRETNFLNGDTGHDT